MRRVLLAACVAALCLPAGAASARTTTIGWADFPDFVDPALSYTQLGWAILSQTHLGLVTFARGESAGGIELIPGAARALPEVSPDGLTYRFTLRSGLRYSSGRRVRARDFEHTIKRVLKLESAGAAFYAATIAGAERYERRGRGDIAGISASGRTITIRLIVPNDQFVHILAMPFAGLVPSGTPMRDLSRRPPPGIGPYRIARVRRNRSVTIRRTRTRIPGLPRPRLAAVQHVTLREPERADVTTDGLAPGRQAPMLATYCFFLNTRTPPFDDVEVRRAVHLGLDKARLAAALGPGVRPACSLVPPELLGGDAAVPCPFAGQDVARAQAMIAAAGAAGAQVTVWGNDDGVRKLVEEYARQLTALGLRAAPKIVAAERYFQEIGRDANRPQTGFANWFADFPHPANFLFLVDPDTNQPTNNQNFARIADPEMKTMIDAGRYAEANQRAVDQAYVVPYARRDFVVNGRRASAMRCAVVHPLYGIDAAQLCR